MTIYEAHYNGWRDGSSCILRHIPPLNKPERLQYLLAYREACCMRRDMDAVLHVEADLRAEFGSWLPYLAELVNELSRLTDVLPPPRQMKEEKP